MRSGSWRDFNEILDDSEKQGGKRKARVGMDDFRKTLDDMTLVNVKSDRGWLTWTNNLRGCGLVKERLDRFVASLGWLRLCPFLSSDVYRQAHFDHDVIILDTLGRKPKDMVRDLRLSFHFEACWAKDRGTKEIIMEVWNKRCGNVLHGCDLVHSSLGSWHRSRFRDSKCHLKDLCTEINEIIDAHRIDGNTERLRYAREELAGLYNAEETYWAQHSHIWWLRVGDRYNTQNSKIIAD